MTLNEYQRLALRTASDKSKRNELFHLLLGLTGETGEISEMFKKLVRDQDSNESMLEVSALRKELGDVLWYVAVLASYFGLDLEEIGQENISKLADRSRRGVLGGSGDDR